VCVEGPAQGLDYRVRGGRNLIGRAAHMNIRIAKDESVVDDYHAVLTYDPRDCSFWLAAGGGTTYRNGAVVDRPLTLQLHDTLEIGHTFLRFIPFCGEAFRWK
jgi:hypothetical protein